MCLKFSAVQEHRPPEKNRSPFIAFPNANLLTSRFAENSSVDAEKKHVIMKAASRGR